MTTSASEAATESASSWVAASTMTRTSGSVPEGRSRTRPVSPRRASAAATAAATASFVDAAARSSGSLRDKLVEREYDAEVIDRVVARLEELGLIDDEEYARNVIRSCTARMMGARGVIRELVRKGVPRPLAERMVRETAQAGVFEDCAWELGRTVAKKNAGKDVEVCKRRFWSAGGRKGHAPEDLRAVSDELFRRRIYE